MKIVERQKAVELRRKGLTYKEIGKRLSVSKSSLSLWLRNIPYVPTEESLQRKRMASINAGQVLHKRKLKRISRIKALAKREIPNIKPEAIKLLGIMAYWTEGSKTDDSHVKFTNTDPRFIKFTLKWLREICKVPEEKLRLHLRIHPDTNRERAEKYWSKLTDIPSERFYKTTIKTSGSNGKSFNKLSNGIASVTVCDTNLFYKIRGWIEGLIDNTKL